MDHDIRETPASPDLSGYTHSAAPARRTKSEEGFEHFGADHREFEGLTDEDRATINIIQARALAYNADICHEYKETMKQQGLDEHQMRFIMSSDQFRTYLTGRVRKYKLKLYEEAGFIKPGEIAPG